MTEITATQATATASPTRTETRLSAPAGALVSVYRIVVSFLFLCHGLQGFGLFGGIDGHGGAVPFGMWPGWWAGAIETAGSVLLLAGLAARPVAVALSGVMAYAYFTVHAPIGLLPLLNMGEEAAFYAWTFLLLAVLGPGRYTVEVLWRRR